MPYLGMYHSRCHSDSFHRQCNTRWHMSHLSNWIDARERVSSEMKYLRLCFSCLPTQWYYFYERGPPPIQDPLSPQFEFFLTHFKTDLESIFLLGGRCRLRTEIYTIPTAWSSTLFFHL